MSQATPFSARVQQFKVSNAATFSALTEEAVSDPSLRPHPPLEANHYGNPPPLESAMGVQVKEREQRLMQVISPGDIVRGHVILKTPIALGVRITSLVGSLTVRGLCGLDVRGLVQLENLADRKSRCEGVLEEMQMEDCVQAVVINKRDGHINLSFDPDHASQFCASGGLPKGLKLGYLESVKPASPRQKPVSFLSELETSPGFINPHSSDNLKDVLGLTGYKSDPKPSLILPIQRASYPEGDYHHALRKTQRHTWSMDTVAVGVKYFKKGELDQAKKVLTHALEIDPNNVEGLVARGALYANNGRYDEAIVDFERALTVNHAHANARKYLVETQVAYGEELERQGKLEKAVVCYREALADDPAQESARARLQTLRKVLEKKAAERVERERKEAAEKARLKKLYSIIRDEKAKKGKRKKKSKVTKKKKDKAVSKKRKKKVKKTASKRKHYSSEDDSISSDSEYSTSSSSSSTSDQRRRRRRRGLSSSTPPTKHSTNSPSFRERGRRRAESRTGDDSTSLTRSPLSKGRRPSKLTPRSHSSTPRDKERGLSRSLSRSHSRTPGKRGGRRLSSKSPSRTPRKRGSRRSSSRSPSRTPRKRGGRRSSSRSLSRTPRKRGRRRSSTPGGSSSRSSSRSHSRTPRKRGRRSPWGSSSRSHSRTPRKRGRRSPWGSSSRSRSRTPRKRGRRSHSRTPRGADRGDGRRPLNLPLTRNSLGSYSAAHTHRTKINNL